MTDSVSMQLYVKDFRELANYTPSVEGYTIRLDKDEDSGIVVIDVEGGTWQENFDVAGSVHDDLVSLGIAQIAPYDGEDVVEL